MLRRAACVARPRWGSLKPAKLAIAPRMNKSSFLLASILVFPLWTSAVPTYTEIFSYPFTGEPGCNPSSKPLEASDGALYGTTARIFAAVPYRDDGAGLLYRINKDGTGHTVLHFFDGATSPNASAVIQTTDGR